MIRNATAQLAHLVMKTATKKKKKTNYKNNYSSELMYDNVVCIVFKVKCRHTRRMRNAQGVSTNKSRHLRQLFINKCMHAHLWSHILLV